ncbi:MAG: MFS transporter [Thermoanaerobaculia bacterium]
MTSPRPVASPFAFWRELAPGARRALVAAFAGWGLDAADFTFFLLALPLLRAEFALSPRDAGLVTTVALLSSAAGGVLAGGLADRFGRVRVLAWTILFYSLASAGSASATSVGQLVAWRALLGLGLGGEWAAGAVLVAESVPAAVRGKALGLMQSGWAIGYLAAAAAAALVLPTLGWRALFLLGSLPALAVFWIRRRVEESANWRAVAPGRRAPFDLAAFAHPPVPVRLAAALGLSSVVMFAYWGLASWMPSFLAAPVAEGGAGLGLVRSALWIVPMQAGAFLGYVATGLAADRFGRRPAAAVVLVGAAAIVPIYGLAARTPLALLLLAPLVGFLAHGYFSVFGALLAELFPTAIRATAQGLAYNGGRAVSAFAPAVIGALAGSRGFGAALATTSAFFLAGALLLYALPETRGARLED